VPNNICGYGKSDQLEVFSALFEKVDEEQITFCQMFAYVTTNNSMIDCVCISSDKKHMEKDTSIDFRFSKQDAIILHYRKARRTIKIGKAQLLLYAFDNPDRGGKPIYFF
jgi:hypothetical protein